MNEQNKKRNAFNKSNELSNFTCVLNGALENVAYFPGVIIKYL